MQERERLWRQRTMAEERFYNDGNRLRRREAGTPTLWLRKAIVALEPLVIGD